MARWHVVVPVALVLAFGCPKRKQPERGAELVFKKTGNVRPVVERRLAQRGLVTRITDDETSLTVRFPDVSPNVDLNSIRRLLEMPAKLEFCAEVKPVDGVESSHRVLVGVAVPDGPIRTFLAEGCLEPRILEVEVNRDQSSNRPTLSMTFDGPTATSFADLTSRLVRRRVLVVLDNRVQSAPLIAEAVTGGRAMLAFGKESSEAEIILVGHALAGGPLPGMMELERTGTYGPPSLMK
jgi:preprotein translocase subunit SecD